MGVELKTVVIVEDEPDTAEMFAEMARLMGYRVFKALSSLKALDLISEHKPFVILLDIMMPELSGIDILRALRQDPRIAATPVVVVSARGTPHDVKVCMEAGASIYLTKPVAFVDLRQAILKATGTLTPSTV